MTADEVLEIFCRGDKHSVDLVKIKCYINVIRIVFSGTVIKVFYGNVINVARLVDGQLCLKMVK